MTGHGDAPGHPTSRSTRRRLRVAQPSQVIVDVGPTSDETMTYRATITSAIGLYVTGSFIAVLLIALGLMSQPAQPGLVIAGAIVLGCLVGIRLRYFVRVSGVELQSRSLVGEARMNWHDMVRVVPANERDYWSSRFFGPMVLEFISSGARLRINFKLFPLECFQDVMRHVPASAKTTR